MLGDSDEVVIRQLRQLVLITRSTGIMRRYFVVNGFDGALTMLGLLTGFRLAGESGGGVMLGACMGTAVALGVSGVTSAYISETAERRRELRDLELAMATDLADSAHGSAARLVPPLIAFVNGASPLLVSLVIIAPLWFERVGIGLPWPALTLAIGVAFVVIFLLGIFLGRIGGGSWLWSGLKTVIVALATVAIILVLKP